jgi:hypothetical protein
MSARREEESKEDILLVSPDLSKGNGTGPVPVRLLDTSSSGTGLGSSGLSRSLGGH